ncbi:dipeptidyl aminopeptidase [Agrocybe pediades]|nr:dipeptidyl aminopeptidase [Agrocybe pediades]
MHEMRQTNPGSVATRPEFTRPQVYYGEGPFDPPSSEDDDDDLVMRRASEDDNDIESASLLHQNQPSSPGRAERGDTSRSVDSEKKHASVRVLAITLIGLVAVAALIGVFAGFAYSGTSYRTLGQKKVTMDHIFNGTFWPRRPDLNWVAEAGDGVFSLSTEGYIKLVDLKSNKTTNLLRTDDVRDEHGNPLYIAEWKLSDDMKYLLVKTDYVKQWRWSSYGNYYVHDIASKSTHPITPPSNPAKTAYATWAPTGNAIAYVTDNDLYILPSAQANTSPIRVTNTGNASLFHGVPDWVYEEEVFSSNYALWWSPDSTKVAFLSLDETAVPEFSFPIYNPTEDSNAVIPYTTEVTMKYPKPGYNNPIVSVHVFDLKRYLDADASLGDSPVEETLTLTWQGRHAPDYSIVTEVTWVGNSSLIVKEVNRNADDGNVVLFELEKQNFAAAAQGKVVRKLGKVGEQGDNGWIDHEQTIYPVPSGITAFEGTNAYLDIVPTPEGYNHIALFSPASTDTPRFLTNGEWEVVGGIAGVDAKKGLVYFKAAKPSTERHIFSVPIPTLKSEKVAEPTPLTDVTKPGFFSAKFSPGAGFYVLDYNGPDIPWTKVVDTDAPDAVHFLEQNELLRNTTAQYAAATIVHSTFVSDGYELNVKEIRPPRMDDSGRTKYPVLFRVYGGPGSQMVDQRFGRDWHEYLAVSLQYVVVTVDGRGTGFKGRKLRNPVKDNLGFWETKDQVEAARAWAKKPYVDPKRIGIWGWSYGGFMSSKVVESTSGIHSLAMAVAPVTSWRLYDSIYTERYMNLPALNPGGYVNASISHVEGFKKVDYLLAHGSGDDNVHYANSARLLDMFTREGVRGFRFRMFTDSDHSISRRGAQREVYEYLTGFLVEKWGKGPRKRI